MARMLLLHSWAGRLFMAAAAFKVVVALLRQFGELPAFIRLLNGAATVGLAVSVGFFVWRLFTLMKRRLLWRLRRRLILSYIFIGVVPALLIIAFFLLGAWTVTMNLSAYLFKDGYDDIVDDARLIAQAAAAEIGRERGGAPQTLARVHRNAAQAYKGLALAFVPMTAEAPAHVEAGLWDHVPAPTAVPEWLRSRSEGWQGTIAVSRPDARNDTELVARAAVPTVSNDRRFGYVIADIPIDPQILDLLYDRTRVRVGVIRRSGGSDAASVVDTINQTEGVTSVSLFSRSVTFFDYHDWNDGSPHRAALSMTFRLRDLYNRLSRAQPGLMGPLSVSDAITLTLVIVAVLFLIIQFVALVMGLALARSITSSIHELSMGTERVRQGDFAHRIKIQAKDQLGDLAGSFNQMTGSIENLLQTAAEKKRLEEELRIARHIQMSLLPRGTLDFPGLTMTALCVPAREVGGDYYDFFKLPQNRLGVLIADVSGKGTSAALYMAELKGLVLSLSQIYFSPRQLLIQVNQIISENLDSRSFITMTYAVIDLAAGTLTYARAGHTPMVYLPGPGALHPAAQVLVPSGMVVGLQIDGAAEKFADLLDEEVVELGAGDVIVLYTDGITEAMNAEFDLFGDSRLSRIVEEHGHLDSVELRERILREIEAFVGGADQHDDMTMILLKVEPARGGQRWPSEHRPPHARASSSSSGRSRPIEADVVKGLLETHGIDTFVRSHMPLTSFPMSVHELRVTVKPEDAARALRIIESHRDDRVQEGASGPMFEPLEALIGYRFRDRGLLEHALTHRSRVHEDATRRRLRQRITRVPGRFDPRLRRRRHAVPRVPAAQRRAEVQAARLDRVGQFAGTPWRTDRARVVSDPGARRREDRRAPQARAHRRLVRGADCRDLPRRRSRAGADVHRASVRGSDRRRAPPRRRGIVHRRLQVCAAGVAAVARPGPAGVPARQPRSAPPTAGVSKSKCSFEASPSRRPKARARRSAAQAAARLALEKMKEEEQEEE